ncbi:hypothetical protein K0M31_003910 [Melipona bicolor]|uniref:Uncharacterized protein n=1 Tax=Melipona bicolor TaxID=60889 RepID=A0AA40FY66_9HYME|nr:hypothetical protein K0M31_003910 [Melipona bicolor]
MEHLGNGRRRRRRSRQKDVGPDGRGATEPGYRNNARSWCIARRAAGRRHGRYKWAGQSVVPSGHEEETHGPAGHIGLRVQAGRTRPPGKTGERRRNDGRGATSNARVGRGAAFEGSVGEVWGPTRRERRLEKW